MAEDQFSANKSSRGLIGEAVLVGVFTLYAYALTFAYEAGYCLAFGIPLSFIEINLTTVLVVAAVLVAVLGIPLLMTYLLYGMLPGLDPMHPIALRIKRLSVIIFVVAAYFATGVKRKAWVLGILAFLVIWEFVLPLVTQRKVKGYIEKLRGDDRTDVVDTPFTRTVLRLGHGPFLVLVFAVVLVPLATLAGQTHAESQTIFLTTKEDLVVLRHYGDNFICARLLPGTKEIERSIILISRNSISDNKLILQQREIGPLSIRRGTEEPLRVQEK